MNYEPSTSIKNPTLAHFRHFKHFRHFSSLFTPSPLYICRGPSTNQPFLCKTNPILSAAGGLQMNVKSYNTKDYKNIANWTLGQNKANSKPIQTQSNPISEMPKMNVNIYYTEDYKNKWLRRVRKNKPNTNPIQTQSKPVLSAPVLSKVEGVEWANFFKDQNELKIACRKIWPHPF